MRADGELKGSGALDPVAGPNKGTGVRDRLHWVSVPSAASGDRRASLSEIHLRADDSSDAAGGGAKGVRPGTGTRAESGAAFAMGTARRTSTWKA